MALTLVSLAKACGVRPGPELLPPPDFARLDVRASWKPRGQGSRWEFYAEVINLTNRKNAGSITPTLAYNPGADRPRIVEQNDPSVPRLPTIGLRWRF